MTFLISPALALMALVDSSVAAEKNVHGRMPAKRTADTLDGVAGKKTVKTIV